jgi:Flp pilus assembly pilin Flp
VTGNARKYTTGQAMVEYAVVLVALTLAVLAVGDGDFSTPEDSNIDELRQAVDFRYRGYTYAVSLSEYPESEDLLEIADYYDSLGKHPELADQMRGGVSTIEGYVEDYVSTTAYFRDFNPDLPDDFDNIDIGAIISDLSGF